MRFLQIPNPFSEPYLNLETFTLQDFCTKTSIY